MQCMTASRCRTRAYWLSTRGRSMDIPEMTKCQGFGANEIDRKDISNDKFGHMLGNAISKNVVKCILSQALYSAGFVDDPLPT